MSDSDLWGYHGNNMGKRDDPRSTFPRPSMPLGQTYFPPMKEDIDNWVPTQGHSQGYAQNHTQNYGQGYGQSYGQGYTGTNVAMLLALNKITYVLMFIAFLFFLGIIILLISMLVPPRTRSMSQLLPPTPLRAERDRWTRGDE